MMIRGVCLKRKAVSVLLTFILVVTCFSQAAFAQGYSDTVTASDNGQAALDVSPDTGVSVENAGDTAASVTEGGAAGETAQDEALPDSADEAQESFAGDADTADDAAAEEVYDDAEYEEEDVIEAQSDDKPMAAGGTQASGKVAIYRMYNPKTGEHLFTTDARERYTLVASYGWKYEGVAWYGPSSGDAVYRVYNKKTGQHLYTKSKNEVNTLVKKHGWSKDNGGQALFYSKGAVAVYRVYNPRKKVGSHHWTTNANEYRALAKLGYRKEGVAFYGTYGQSLISTSKAATVKAGSVTADASKDGQKTFVVYANSVSMKGNIQKIGFAVWSEDKSKDDLVKYTASYVSASSYKATVSISKHKSPGKYYAVAYTVTPAGKELTLGTATFTVTKPTGKVTVSNVNSDKGTFKLTASSLSSVSGISAVKFAVWCKSDQSDLKWYTGNAQSDGTYTTSVSAIYHKYHSGTYKIHEYLIAGNGLAVCSATASQAVSIKTLIDATALDKMRTAYKITVVNPVGEAGKATAVKLATWSTTGGQDDLVWYNATKQSDGSFTATIQASNHKHGGEFTTHVYGIIGGSPVKVGSITYNVKSFSLTGLAAFVKTKIGTPYVYGTAGEKLTLSRYYELQKLYGKDMVWDSDIKKVGKVCTDCSGLISWYTGVRMTSYSYYQTAVKRVPISKLDNSMIGYILWLPGHVGVYIGNGYYIGADGSQYGVQKKPVSWQKWSYALLPAGFQK